MINALDLGFRREASKEVAVANAGILNPEKRLADDICFPPGEYPWFGASHPSTQFGAPPIRGAGTTGYARPSQDTVPDYGTRFTQWDGVSPIFEFTSTRQKVSDIEFRSRPWAQDLTGDGPQDGQRAKAAIVVRNDWVPTGHLRFQDCLFTDFETAIVTTGTNNCDNSLVDNCTFHNCDWAFQSENPQTVNWHFRDCRIFFWGGKGLRPLGIANMIRGGECRFDFTADALQLTGIRVCDYSENTSDYAELNIRWDQPPAAGNYLTAFEYAGDPKPKELGWKRWTVNGRITVNNIKNETLPTVTKFKAPRGLPTDGIKVEVVRGAK